MRQKLVVGLSIGIAALQGMATMALAVNRTVSGGANTGIAIATSDDNSIVGSTTAYTTLPGMTLSVNTPDGSDSILDIRFSAESACYGGDVGSPEWCSVQILVDGVQAIPNNCRNAMDFALDSTDNGSESSASWESHAMERWIRVAKGGAHRVLVQGAVTQFGSVAPTFWTGERNLTVETFPRIATAGGCPTTTGPTGPSRGQAPASPVADQ